MSNDLKKFAPSQAEHDALAGAPRPEPVKGVEAPNWKGRPILHPDHAQDLETESAVNEFALKMPRDEAEHQAYGDYVTRQREQAMDYHRLGVKAAEGAGDNEAARKHGLMYAAHAQALGHEPVGPVPTHIVGSNKQKAYRFKPHKGDLFALEQKAPEGIVTTAQPHAELGKNERDLLHTIWRGARALLKSDVADWARSELLKKKGPAKKKEVPCRCDAYSHPHRTGGGKCPAGK